MMVVDVDDPATWPAGLAVRVDEVADQMRGTTEYFGDLPVEDHERELVDLLAGCLVRAYHCTRLLDHEAAAIRSGGLRALDELLVTSRIEAARERGYLTEDLAATLQAAHHFAKPLSGDRGGAVCLVLSATTFDHHASGLHHLLSTWGGEAIYWRHLDAKTPLRQKLGDLGRPTIVQALLDLHAPGTHRVHRSMAHVLVGAALGLPELSGEVHYGASIPGEHIEQLIQPGNPDYDCHIELPRR
jgi:hypothetical protein